jgi:hypothetical protein
VWEFKQKLLQAKEYLHTTSDAIAILKETVNQNPKKSKITAKFEEHVRKQYELIYQFDPDLRTYAPIQQTKK